jgi:hypothetical protein
MGWRARWGFFPWLRQQRFWDWVVSSRPQRCHCLHAARSVAEIRARSYDLQSLLHLGLGNWDGAEVQAIDLRQER